MNKQAKFCQFTLFFTVTAGHSPTSRDSRCRSQGGNHKPFNLLSLHVLILRRVLLSLSVKGTVFISSLLLK